MDIMYFFIILLFLVILILDHLDRKNKSYQNIKENFQSLIPKKFFEADKSTSGTIVGYSGNIGDKYQDFGNFSIIDVNPPNPACNLNLQPENCAGKGYTEYNRDEFMPVCNILANKKDPNGFYSLARSIGTPRTCRKYYTMK
jgi:hypothetical protein